MEPVSLALAPLGFLELAPADLISVAAGAGFGSVAIRACAATPGGVEYRLAAGSDHLRGIGRQMRDAGITLAQVELISLDRAMRARDHEAMFAGAAELGCRRVVAAGDDPDLSLLAERMAELCELAALYEMSVDLEFMPFRPLMTLSQADAVVMQTGADNAFVMIDMLHLFRSGGNAAALRAVDPKRLGVVQICDAPLLAPAPDKLVDEAREARLLPGQGELPLVEVMQALPVDIIVAAECPIQRQYPELSAAERAELVYRASCRFLGAL